MITMNSNLLCKPSRDKPMINDHFTPRIDSDLCQLDNNTLTQIKAETFCLMLLLVCFCV